ncbi:hypothetical protein [Streptomyces sp. WAC 06783]|uniref:hypothetical protein n=1 Tax=Streptomyces sp. WAC 06783 TaxID=2203211 RepID=UPI0021AD9C59|nr:hypothetical protein [Streptomyces sp. WAC 06783]
MITTDAPTEDPGKSHVHNVALTRRRTLLAGSVLGGAALLLTSCSEDAGPGGSRQEADAAAEARLRGQAARDSAALLAHYDATLAAHPGLGERLRPLRAEVARHAAAFGGASPAPSAPSTAPRAGASAAPSASATASAPASPAVPSDEKQARADLAAAERRTADARAAALVSAPPELARLLASVAAAGAAHAYLLTEDGA